MGRGIRTRRDNDDEGLGRDREWHQHENSFSSWKQVILRLGLHSPRQVLQSISNDTSYSVIRPGYQALGEGENKTRARKKTSD